MKSIFTLLALGLLLGCSDHPSASSSSIKAVDWVDVLYRNPLDEAHYPSERAASLAVPELAVLLRQAVEVRKAHEKKAPDEKPPFADYPLLWAGPDAPERHRIYTSTEGLEADGTTRVVVELRYRAADGVDPDYVVLDLQPDASAWKIARIRYASSSETPRDLAARLRADLADEKAVAPTR